MVEGVLHLDHLGHRVGQRHDLCGGAAPGEVVELADTVTEMVKVKHAFDQNIRARKGIEY